MSSILSRKAEGHMYPLLRTLFPDSSLHVSRDKPHAFLVSHPDDFTQYRIQPDGFWEHEEDGSCGDIIGLVEKVKRLSYEEAEAWLKDFLQNPAMHFSIPDNIKEELKGNFSDQRSLHAPRELSEESIAMKYAGSSLKWLRHIPAWKRYLVYDDVLGYWKYDEKNEAKYHVRNFCRGSSPFVADATARKLESNKTADAVLNLVGTDQRLVITPDQLDADPWMLNTPNRVYNFRSGRSRKMHRHTDYFTKVTAVPVDDDMETPLWDQFLLDITAGDSDLIGFLQRMAGYALIGTTQEQKLFFLYGTGRNGKSVFLNTVAEALGDYAMTATMELLTASNNDRHPTELAMLKGARLVTAQETEEGRRWAESKIKTLTGGDTITARFMRQDFFTFTPQFTLIVAGNHKPGIRNVDVAMRRRMVLVPFTTTIPADKCDPTLPERLKEELPGILAWCIGGAYSWMDSGISIPDVVLNATSEYMNDQDCIERWISEACALDHSGTATMTDLFLSYLGWCARNGEVAGSQKSFSQKLRSKHPEFEDWKCPRTRRNGLRGVSIVACEAVQFGQ